MNSNARVPPEALRAPRFSQYLNSTISNAPLKGKSKTHLKEFSVKIFVTILCGTHLYIDVAKITKFLALNF